jgi:hypothetical protein
MEVMELKEAPVSATRKGDRVSISIGVQISGADTAGQHFSEIMHTVNVSRSGCCLLTKRSLPPGQKLRLIRTGNAEEVSGRVVGQTGMRPEGNLFGVEVLNASENFWGIRFPQQKDLEHGAGRTLLKCPACEHTEEVALNEVELSVFQITHHLTRKCPTCAATGLWEGVPETSVSANGSTPGKPAEKRRYARISMKTHACVGQPGPNADIVEVVNVSRGGVCFHSSRNYARDSWVQVAVPYTPGAANIFVSGRIVRSRKLGDSATEYGVEYVKS